MPNGQGETPADYAWDAARTAQRAAQTLETRVARLERILIARGIMTEADLRAQP